MPIPRSDVRSLRRQGHRTRFALPPSRTCLLADCFGAGLLAHYHKSIQCKRIYLAGCCHDNGYLHDLRDYKGVPDGALVLIETTQAEPSFGDLGFPIVRFENVFRSQPLNNETKRVAQTMPPPPLTEVPTRPIPTPRANPQPQESQDVTITSPPPKTPVQLKSPSPTPSPSAAASKTPNRSQSTPQVFTSANGGTSINYAKVGGAGDTTGNVTIKTSKPKKPARVIWCNVDMGRLDPPTQHPPRNPAQSTYQAKFQSIKPSVFCNDHYLKGRCKWGINCDKTHDAELTSSELAIHRYKARTSMCPQGPHCDEYDCYLSHHCFRDPCTNKNCQFLDTPKFGDLHYSTSQMKPA